MPTRWFRVNLWIHRWTSLLATLPFLVLCLTGTILIFHDEIDAALVGESGGAGEGSVNGGVSVPADSVVRARL